jgi:hypothetical protein
MPNCLKVVSQDTDKVVLSVLINKSHLDCSIENGPQTCDYSLLVRVKHKLKRLSNHKFDREVLKVIKHIVHIGEHSVVLIIKSYTKDLVVLVVSNTALQKLDEALSGSDEFRSLDKAQKMRDSLVVLSVRECDTIDSSRRVDGHCFSS